MSALALDLTHELFWVDQGLVEALGAVEAGKTWYYHTWTAKEVIASEVIDRVQVMALRAEIACSGAFPDLEATCRRMASALSTAKTGAPARQCLAEVSRLTAAGREWLEAADGVLA